MKLALFGWILSATLAAPVMAQTPATAPALSVEFGKPTFIHRLTYQKMYSEKPFEQAVLYYYDNGLYKIISPGEEHYGVYVVKGDINAPQYSISYISLPHADWAGNVARHDLKFNSAIGAFEQQALTPADQQIPRQHGIFELADNTVENPLDEKWPTGQ